ncbi:MAG: TolC family protein [Deltaproteobacteria bacterium]
MIKKHFGILVTAAVLSCAAIIHAAYAEGPSAQHGVDESYGGANSETSADKELEEPGGPVTLRQALALALMKNPELQAFSLEIRAREAQALQAGLPPNPEIGFGLEDFGGTGSVEGFKGTETTVLLSQLIPLGGKLSKRRKVAALNTDLAEWDYKTVRLDVLTQTSLAFLNLLAAQKRLALDLELVGLAEKVHTTVSEQAGAGQISPIQAKRSQVALSQARIRLERTKRELEAAKKILASTWGSKDINFNEAVGKLDSISPVPEYEKLTDLLSQNPDIARWATEMEQREAKLGLEKANAIPDPFVSGGYRRLGENDDNAFVVGISIPIPVLNRNQGGISEARRRVAKAIEEQKNAEVTVNAALASAFHNLSASYEEVILLKEDVLPQAESAYDSIFEGYREGKFALLDVLDAQRTVFDARAQYIEALRSYHSSKANVERLIGAPIEGIENYDRRNTGRGESETKDQIIVEKKEQ